MPIVFLVFADPHLVLVEYHASSYCALCLGLCENCGASFAFRFSRSIGQSVSRALVSVVALVVHCQTAVSCRRPEIERSMKHDRLHERVFCAASHCNTLMRAEPTDFWCTKRCKFLHLSGS